MTYVISGNTQTGYGVTTALFKRHGFIVISQLVFLSLSQESRPASLLPNLIHLLQLFFQSSRRVEMLLYEDFFEY